MRIIFFGNNRVGLEVLNWLVAQGDEVVALVVHEAGRARFREDMVRSTGLPLSRVFEGPALRDPATVEAIRALRPDIGASVFFGHIIRAEVISLFPSGILNLHPAYLPYNRGAFPNVWSIIDGTPAGVTFHYVDEGVDTGDIVARRDVPVLTTDTGMSLYARLEEACIRLFSESWPLVRDGRAVRTPQARAEGTHHRMSDVEKIDRIDPDRMYTARELIDVIRARTFPPYHGAYIEEDGSRVYLRLQLLTEEEIRREQQK